MSNTIRGRLIPWVPAITLLFCVIQPLLDVLGYWQNEWGISNLFTLLVRSLFLVVTVAMGFLITKRKWIYLLMGGGICLLLAGHLLACIQAGGLPGVADLANQVRILSLYPTTLCIITFLEASPKTYPRLKLGMVCALGIILAVMLLATATGTDPHTYAERGYGVLGWFLWPNTQSAILSISVPIVLSWALNRWKKQVLPICITAVLTLGALYLLAPRLAYAAMAVTGLGLGVCLILLDRRRWRQGAALVLCTVALIGLYPISPLAANRAEIAAYAQVKQATVDQLMEDCGLTQETLDALAAGEPVEDEDAAYAALEQVYDLYLEGVVDRFGIRTVAERYDYTTSASTLSDVRKQKITFCTLLLEGSPASAAVFGMDVERMREDNVLRFDRQTSSWTVAEGYYDVENDLYGMFFLSGMVGLCAVLCFLGYFGLRILFSVVGNPRRYVTWELAAVVIAFGCALVHIVFTASLLRRNNGSFYLACLLGMIWYLTGSLRQAAAENAPRPL